MEWVSLSVPLSRMATGAVGERWFREWEDVVLLLDEGLQDAATWAYSGGVDVVE